MATNVQLIPEASRQPTVTSAVDVYTSPANGGGTRITKFSATLETGTESYTTYVGTAANAATRVVSTTSITGPNQESPASMVGIFLKPGDRLWVQVTTGTTITFDAAGIEL